MIYAISSLSAEQTGWLALLDQNYLWFWTQRRFCTISENPGNWRIQRNPWFLKKPTYLFRFPMKTCFSRHWKTFFWDILFASRRRRLASILSSFWRSFQRRIHHSFCFRVDPAREKLRLPYVFFDCSNDWDWRTSPCLPHPPDALQKECQNRFQHP